MFDEGLKIKDLKYEGRGVFHYINELEPFTFNELISVDSLQLGFDMLHGEKQLSPYIVNIFILSNKEYTLNEIGKVINMMFRIKWDKIINTYENEINLDTYRRTTTENIKEVGSRSNTREDINQGERVNQVTTFDSEDYSNNDKETNTNNLQSTDTGETDVNKDVTKEVTGSVHNRLDDIRKITNLLNNNVINDIIYTDVKQLIGLNIY